MVTNALNGQSMLDLAIQLYGSVEGVFDLAAESGKSITDKLEAGEPLQYSGAPLNKAIADYYRANSIRPATEPAEMPIPTGVGGMGIEIDLIVS